jgi:hypothetical protein
MPTQQDQGSCEQFSAMTASKLKRSLVSATTALKLKRRRDACASTATRQQICNVGNFIVYCRKAGPEEKGIEIFCRRR